MKGHESLGKRGSPVSAFQKYSTSLLKLGMKFTAPVFFDDGVNMFLAENCAVKKYHLEAVKQWAFTDVLTYGKLTPDSPRADNGAIPVAASYTGQNPGKPGGAGENEYLEELEAAE
jgi:hypothetical protein